MLTCNVQTQRFISKTFYCELKNAVTNKTTVHHLLTRKLWHSPKLFKCNTKKHETDMRIFEVLQSVALHIVETPNHSVVVPTACQSVSFGRMMRDGTTVDPAGSIRLVPDFSWNALVSRMFHAARFRCRSKVGGLDTADFWTSAV